MKTIEEIRAEIRKLQAIVDKMNKEQQDSISPVDVANLQMLINNKDAQIKVLYWVLYTD